MKDFKGLKVPIEADFSKNKQLAIMRQSSWCGAGSCSTTICNDCLFFGGNIEKFREWEKKLFKEMVKK